MGCIDLRFTEDDTLEEEHLVSWMPDCNVNHAALFSHLVKLVLDTAKEGRAIRQADLLQALIRLDVQVKPLEQQSAFPVQSAVIIMTILRCRPTWSPSRTAGGGKADPVG